MPDTPANEHPDSFHQADLAVGRLVEVVRHEAASHPHLRDDQRVYPHPDHLRARHLGPRAERAGDPDWYPELGDPFQPQAVLLGLVPRADARHARGAARPRRQLTVRREVVRTPGHGPPDHDPCRGRRVPVGPVAGAGRAHAMQVDPNEKFWFAPTTSSPSSIRGRTGSSPVRWRGRSPPATRA